MEVRFMEYRVKITITSSVEDDVWANSEEEARASALAYYNQGGYDQFLFNFKKPKCDVVILGENCPNCGMILERRETKYAGDVVIADASYCTLCGYFRNNIP
jgi:uncharacterized protein YbbK (DUF523 family)